MVFPVMKTKEMRDRIYKQVLREAICYYILYQMKCSTLTIL